MNKEVIVAIIIGVTLGIGGALYFSNINPNSSNSDRKGLTNNIDITPRTTTNNQELAEFDNLPKQEEILTKGTLRLSGRAQKSGIIVAANRLAIVPIPVKGGEFREEFDLKPGTNEMVLYDQNGDKEQLKIIKLYYLSLSNDTPEGSGKEASGEANLLKKKLEAKVIELRNNPTKVVNGIVKSVKDKVLTVVSNNETTMVTVEPEITDFYSVEEYALAEVAFEDIAKDDEVTAFVSDIGGDEISYTLYREPQTSIAAGKVSNIDKDSYQITIINFDKSSFGADIEVGTSQNVLETKTQKIVKGGFSKLAIGDRIFARLFGPKDDYSIDEYVVLK